MTKISKQLQRSLALTDAQTSVYLAALELGEATMQDLADKSGVKRTSIYNFIDDLKERGFLTEVKKKKRKLYGAVDPNQLLEIERLRVREMESLMSELQAIRNVTRRKPRVTFYEGVQHVLAVYDDQLKERKPILAYEDLEYMKRAMPESFYADWPTERARRNIPFRSILRDSTAAREFTKKNIKLLRQTKIIQADPWKTEINIYGDKVAFMRFREDHAMCILIEDKDIAETMRSTWQRLWDTLPEASIG